MGQYFMVVNLDKKEFLNPHKFAEGLKMREFSSGSDGTMTALALLLARGNGGNGGDWRPHELLGRWSGDRITIDGDYAGGVCEDLSDPEQGYRDISWDAIHALCQQPDVREDYASRRYFGGILDDAPQWLKELRESRTFIGDGKLPK